MKKEKPKYNMWQNTGFMVRTAWENRKSVITLAVVLIICTVTINLAQLFLAPVILGEIENEASVTELLMSIVIFVSILIICNGLVGYYNSCSTLGRTDVRMKLQNLVNHKFDTTSLPNVENEKFQGKYKRCVYATINNYSDTEYIWTAITDLSVGVISFIIYLAMLTNVSFYMVTITCVLSLIGYVFSHKINEWGYRHRDEKEKINKEYYYAYDRSVEDELSKDIRIFGLKNWLNEIYYKAHNLNLDFSRKRESIYIWANILDLILVILKNFIAYFYLITLILNNQLTVSEFLLYFSAVTAFNSILTNTLDKFSQMHKLSLEISVVREFLEFPEPFKFEEGKSIEPIQNKDYTIELKNVSFKYDETADFTLKNINLTLKSGEKLAVVGLNGAGKTTLIKLICGFYDPTQGEVLLNGTNIKEFDRRDYYKHFSAVFQDFSILDVTLTENISQTGKAINYNKIAECLEKAGLTEKVNSLPNKYETHLGRSVYEDGVEFSGGETQRLMLARALYKNAPIIILDEPTAALDPLAESDMYQKYNSMTKGKSSIYISHRLASTRFCDRIILLDGAKIAEVGTHDDLIAQNGIYKNLFDVQKKYYQEGKDY
ncbi:MAG: ABC transporter ATP-binding protein [Clostridia bacterium]